MAGQVVDMPYAVATSCISNGTACLPEDDHKVRGLLKVPASELEEAVETGGMVEVEGAVEDTKTKAGKAVSIPENWRNLPWFTQKSLAQKISGGPVSNKSAAVKIIADAEGN